MPQPPRDNTKRASPRLYLLTPVIEDAARFAREFAGLADGSDIAAVLLRLKAADERTLINRVKALAPAVQNAGAALVLDGQADLVARGGADGAHISGVEAFVAAVGSLKPERIAGCAGLHTRHDAMTAAESGADYVMFGEPDGGGQRPSTEAIVERIEWWAEVFEVPCVGYAASLDEIGTLVTAGADFVAVGDCIWNAPVGAAAALAAAAERLAQMEAAG